MLIHNHRLTSRATLTLFAVLQVILCNTGTAQIMSLESSIMMSSSTVLEGSSYWYPNERLASLPKSPDKRTISLLSDFFLWKEGVESALANAQRESSHILIAVDGDRSENEARDLASSVYDQLKAGDDFEALVTEFSDDAGSVGAGGSLGPASKGVFAPEFESMLWSMNEEGEISEPVKTDFGYHLIRLDRVQGVEYPDLIESRDELVASLRLDAARELFQEKSLDLERFSYDERYGLVDTGEQLGVSVVKAENISRSDQGSHAEWLSGIDVLDSIFGDEVPLGENGPLIEVGDERVLVIRAYDRKDPDLIPLEKVSELIKEALIREKTDIAIAEAQQTAMDRLQEGASVSAVADEFGLRWSSHEMVRRTTDQEIPQEVLSLAFQLPRP